MIMNDILLTLGVIVLFVARIGIPMMILIGLGIALDRWQSRREKNYSQDDVPTENRR
jgi:type III secretory pathway component EscR